MKSPHLLLTVPVLLILAVFSVPLIPVHAQCDGGPGDDSVNCNVDDLDGADLGGGNDTINVSDGPGGSPTLDGGATDPGIDGGSGDDIVNVTGGATISGTDGIYGGWGNDDIDVTGSPTITGIFSGPGSGGDTISVGGDAIVTEGSMSAGIAGSDGGCCGDSITVTDNAQVTGTTGIRSWGGDDTITVSGNATVTGTGGTAIEASWGDDTVTIDDSPTVNGTINGGANGTPGDTLNFQMEASSQADLDAWNTNFPADPSGGPHTNSLGSSSFTWVNFEWVNNWVTYIAIVGASGSTGNALDDGISDCGRNPYWGQRAFDAVCAGFTNDPNETLCSGLTYEEAVAEGLIQP